MTFIWNRFGRKERFLASKICRVSEPLHPGYQQIVQYHWRDDSSGDDVFGRHRCIIALCLQLTD
jgi:hypothetical protein